MDDQVDHLLFRKARVHAEARERQVISRLALVLQVVAPPEPGVLEAHILAHPGIEHLLWNPRV